jgi:hypothetical protein
MGLHFKRGAAHDKGGHNPINSRTPEEYVCVIGSVPNTFNGYMYFETDPGPTHGWVPMPEPRFVADVPRFITGPKGKHTVTHDVYWANFLDPAVKVFANKIAQPKPGDIVTFLIFMAGYLDRQEKDWDASPYNTERHRYSPWVRGKPEFDPYAGTGSAPTPLPPTGLETPKKKDPSNTASTTSGNKDGTLNRSVDGSDFIAYIHDIPRRVMYGDSLSGHPVMADVLVKLLVFSDISDFSDYLNLGTFANAAYWRHPLSTVSENDTGMVQVTKEGTYFDVALDFSSREWKARWKRLLKAGAKPPEIDRTKIKIKRFDYFSHSDPDKFYFLYGWGNKKGELPNKEVCSMTTDELTAALPRKNLTGNSFAQLWGCNLGQTMAPALTDRFKEGVACESSTYFDHILDNDSAMPVPEAGFEWKTFMRK